MVTKVVCNGKVGGPLTVLVKEMYFCVNIVQLDEGVQQVGDKELTF